MRHAWIVSVLAVCAAVALAACSSSTGHPTTGPPLGWARGFAEAADGSVGTVSVDSVCGSSTDVFLVELLHHSVSDLKVMREWGDVPPAGRQVLVAGTVATVFMGSGDLPMDHPFGDDLSMDVTLSDPFKPFSLKLGSAASDTAPGRLHVEISSGMIPHLPVMAAAPGDQPWPQHSRQAMSGFQPGFDHPAVGDLLVVAGRFIVDCGHPDYHDELHPISFLAWAHTSGTTTTVHVYANGYWDPELFNPDVTAAGRVGDSGRLSAADTKPLPRYLVDEVLRLASGGTDRLRTYQLLGSQRPPDTSWQICAPTGTTGTHLTVHYDVRTRPGVGVSVTPNGSTGCAAVHTATAASYASPAVQVRSCVLPWDYLDQIAAQALAGPVRTRALIDANVPAAIRPLVDRDPLTGCAGPLAAPPVAAQPPGRTITTEPDQPFPFYGVFTVSRA